MGARMMGDDRLPDNGRRVFEQLRRDVDQLERSVGRLAGKIEDVSVLLERVETNRREINRLRSTVNSPGGVSDRLAKLANGDDTAELMPWKLLIAVISAIATVVSAIVAAVAMVVVG